MKKMLRILCLTLLTALSLCVLALAAEDIFTEESTEVPSGIVSGECGAEGDNLTWTLDTTSGELTISGTGAMKDYSPPALDDPAPWKDYLQEIVSIRVEYGVTSIGGRAFQACSVENVSISNTVERIGDMAFYGCRNYEAVGIPAGVTEIGDRAFAGIGAGDIWVHDNNPVYQTIDGAVFTKDASWSSSPPAAAVPMRFPRVLLWHLVRLTAAT